MRFEEVLKNKDENAILELFFWEGVNEKTKTSLLDNIIGELLKEDVKGVKFEPLSDGFKQEYVVKGIRYRPNIPILGFVKVTHETRNFSNATSLPYGQKGDAFYFTATVEEKVSESVSKDVSLNVAILGSATYPTDDHFSGYYVYLQGGKEIKTVFKANGNESYAFWGEKIVYCELRKTSGDGPVSLMITENGREVFRSPMSESYEPVIYKPDQV